MLVSNSSISDCTSETFSSEPSSQRVANDGGGTADLPSAAEIAFSSVCDRSRSASTLAAIRITAAEIPPVHQTPRRPFRGIVGAATGNRNSSGNRIAVGCCTCARHCSKSCATSSAVPHLAYLLLESLQTLRCYADPLLAIQSKTQELAFPDPPCPALGDVHLQSQKLLNQAWIEANAESVPSRRPALPPAS